MKLLFVELLVGRGEAEKEEGRFTLRRLLSAGFADKDGWLELEKDDMLNY